MSDSTAHAIPLPFDDEPTRPYHPTPPPATPASARAADCPACGHLRPEGRLVFCAPICAATHRAIWSVLLAAGDQIDMPFLFGSASQIAGTKPGDQLYVRSSMAPVLHVRAVTELRGERGEVVGLEAAEVHGWRATERHRIGAGDLEGWTPYGRIGPSGEFQAAEGSRP